jgi:hypothetical protein
MERNFEMQTAPAGMFDNESNTTCGIKVRNGEEVGRSDHFTMVVQKSTGLLVNRRVAGEGRRSPLPAAASLIWGTSRST